MAQGIKLAGWGLGLVALFGAALAGYRIAFQSPDGQTRPSGDTPEHRPEFTLPDLSGARRHVSEWDGRPLLINFWATWCVPCRREIPRLIDAQAAYGDDGLQVVGIALDDQEAARPYAREMEINYPVLVAGPAGIELARAYGEDFGALPYTVLVAPDGTIIDSHTGELQSSQLHGLVERALDSR